jgi:hypothetical protein
LAQNPSAAMDSVFVRTDCDNEARLSSPALQKYEEIGRGWQWQTRQARPKPNGCPRVSVRIGGG